MIRKYGLKCESTYTASNKDLRNNSSSGICSLNIFSKSNLFHCQQIHWQLHADQVYTRQITLHPDAVNLESWADDRSIKGIEAALEFGGIKVKELKITTG